MIGSIGTVILPVLMADLIVSKALSMARLASYGYSHPNSLGEPPFYLMKRPDSKPCMKSDSLEKSSSPVRAKETLRISARLTSFAMNMIVISVLYYKLK